LADSGSRYGRGAPRRTTNAETLRPQRTVSYKKFSGSSATSAFQLDGEARAVFKSV
jgi:hypothetical protein